jgi:crossover junction endodeoxyribonuclease RusA
MNITLPYPPSANRYWRYNRGQIHRSAEADAYKTEIGWKCKIARLSPSPNPVKIWLDVYRPAKRGDLDNLAKVILDGLQGHLYHNDSQVIELHMRRFDDKHNPRVEVRMTFARAASTPSKQKAREKKAATPPTRKGAKTPATNSTKRPARPTQKPATGQHLHLAAGGKT